jgi:ZIP family zinc transporter
VTAPLRDGGVAVRDVPARPHSPLTIDRDGSPASYSRARSPRDGSESVSPTASADAARRSSSLWVKGLAPLVVVVLLVIAFLQLGPRGVFTGAFPPIEELTIQRIALPTPGEMRVHVINGGPEPVTIAQVLVDDATWVHTLDGDRTIGRLQSRVITLPYPWVEGEPHVVKLISSTGVTFEGDVAVATQTPAVDTRYVTTFALLGLYAGVIPVFVGLLWFPFLRGIRREWLDFFLSLTVGLLVFLGVEALLEAFENAARVPGAFQGSGIVLLGVGGTPLLLASLGEWRARRGQTRTPLYVATLIAVGIGLHNLGEGLAIGASYATGAIALGTFLVVGFLLHNTTEGLGILAPLAAERPSIAQLALLGAIAGVPTIIGAWLGGFTYSPTLTTLFFAIGAGAIAQVVIELWRLFARNRGSSWIASPLNAVGLMAGLLIMYATGLLVTA